MFCLVLTLSVFGLSRAAPTISITTQSPENTTTPFDCSFYRPHPEHATMYEVFDKNDWSNKTCLEALIWNQERCRCENPPAVDMICPDIRGVKNDTTKYQLRLWGVWLELLKECPKNQIWNQTSCQCDWDPLGPGAVVDAPELPSVERHCDVMLNATFNTDIKDVQGNYIGRSPWNAIDIQETDGSIGGGSARVKGGKMVLWSMAQNDFSDAFQMQLRFKIDADLTSDSTEYVTLLSNDCDTDEPSVVIKYYLGSHNYTVYFRDNSGNSKTMECPSNSKDQQAFQAISLEYQDGTLTLNVDSQTLCSSDNFSGKPAITKCPLYLAGDARGVKNNLRGFVDEVVIRRNCIETA